ncbi:WbqC family protein [Rufibacter roseus]|uniref:WbqC family protein n=1 Tax=Rufibacter roseus TaxID=1567108 RepID=A0ABW2DL74_9BACT|nr:WbqC family protein [Rufibacter roseus]
MAKKIAILQSNYIPWKGYFDIINTVDEFIFYDEMQYTKNDWRNRNKIKSQNGVQWITIPVIQNNLEQKINETVVFDKKWNIKHWRTLQQSYSKAPYFKQYKETFEELYTNIGTEYLSQINYKLIQTICSILGITTSLTWSENYKIGEGKTERLVRLVQAAGGTEYVSGPAARDYLDVSLFEKEGITVSWMDYSNYPEYHQLFPPFEHGVSVLDLIFNEGPNSPNLMKTFNR